MPSKTTRKQLLRSINGFDRRLNCRVLRRSEGGACELEVGDGCERAIIRSRCGGAKRGGTKRGAERYEDFQGPAEAEALFAQSASEAVRSSD